MYHALLSNSSKWKTDSVPLVVPQEAHHAWS